MPFSVLGSDLSLSTTMASVLTVTFGASQIGEIDTCLTVTLPANHGGLQLAWKLPAVWPFYSITQKWSRSVIDSSDGDTLIDGQPVATPTNLDWTVILPPGPLPTVIRVKAVHTFKAPAGGGTLSLMAGMVAIAASPTVINTNPTSHLDSFAWFELQ